MHPHLIEIGSFTLPTYGALVASGFLAGLWVMLRLARPYKLNEETLTNLAIQGGFLLALGVGIWYMRRMKLPALLTMDLFAPGLALGHAIGRIGCLMAGCCYGAECDRAWGITFMNMQANRLSGTPIGVPLHPTQLYEAAGNLAIFGLLWKFMEKRPAPGRVFALYLVCYSTLRFAVEFYRHHDQALMAGLSNTQWISMATLIAGAWLWQRTRATTVRP
ncbi:MAG: prolipoprotein diacylglyceryl transferase [Bryobacter sp.]|nr:prolipoprotein diacylglyceryl transferase [Bryobacter sp.]